MLMSLWGGSYGEIEFANYATDYAKAGPVILNCGIPAGGG